MKNNKLRIFVLIIMSIVLCDKQVDSVTINNLQKSDIQKIDIQKIDIKIEQMNTFNPNLVLVNKENRLEKDDYSKKIKIPDVEFISNGDRNVREMEEEAAEALENLFNAAKKKNIILLGVSGYRNYYYQEKLYNDKVERSGKEDADKLVAQPGESEHQTGLAMDVLSNEYTTLDEGFKYTKAYKWINENCYKYGFIVRYPEGKEQITGYDYEPWHIRYVGNEVAKEIAYKGITLEEYLNTSIANK